MCSTVSEKGDNVTVTRKLWPPETKTPSSSTKASSNLLKHLQVGFLLLVMPYYAQLRRIALLYPFMTDYKIEHSQHADGKSFSQKAMLSLVIRFMRMTNAAVLHTRICQARYQL